MGTEQELFEQDIGFQLNLKQKQYGIIGYVMKMKSIEF